MKNIAHTISKLLSIATLLSFLMIGLANANTNHECNQAVIGLISLLNQEPNLNNQTEEIERQKQFVDLMCGLEGYSAIAVHKHLEKQEFYYQDAYSLP